MKKTGALIYYLLFSIFNLQSTMLFLGFNLHAWITIVTVLTMFSVLLFSKLRSDIVFL